MGTFKEELPADLAAVAGPFAAAAAPFEAARGNDKAPDTHAEFLEVAGFLVGVVGLLVSLIGVYSAGIEARRRRVPDFQQLLDGLVAGTTSPQEALATLGRWKPELTPAEVAEQWKSGNIARYQEVLGRLGYPPAVVEKILQASFGAIAELAQKP
ncbi:hypothetical protein CQ018_12455 [Arthrobacter sp. MYb227]|uniref:hypothetical protein n=1 Tax=Arthrobacter sp. MYb227 TaxID=1848601 RepID=UPI000CFC4B7F|nr:hypothetical protein [Arthrobacter sp. MYb227]PQZ92309.1 hypothetical protein CQ018_12455 [Arthrobacter sp. MYb227]